MQSFSKLPNIAKISSFIFIITFQRFIVLSTTCIFMAMAYGPFMSALKKTRKKDIAKVLTCQRALWPPLGLFPASLYFVQSFVSQQLSGKCNGTLNTKQNVTQV